MNQITDSLINECIKKEEPCENNDNMNSEPNILQGSIKIKEEDIKLEPDFDTFSDKEDSITEQSYPGMVEFVEIQDVKSEKVDDNNEEEDPIKITDGTFICDYCRREFTTSEYCQKHIRRCRDRVYNQPSTSAASISDKKPRLTNDGEQLYQCDKCDNKYKSQKSLNEHLRRHSGLHTCTECSKQFTGPSNLAKHLLIHTGEKPLKCTRCETAFKTASSLTAHMLTHSGARPYKCANCGQSFTHSCHLTRHMRTHTAERPYKCTQCNKTFISSHHLTTHMRTHSGERPYKCAQCSKVFTTSSNLALHLRIHTGEKPYQCTVCSREFAQSSNLKTHMKKHSSRTSNKQ